jgi:thiol-disulfide isomerase/thioredoxin/outer membrane lipoprotein-sorting protein
MFLAAALPLVFALLPVQSNPPKDGLSLLSEVGQRYIDAKSYHIEAVEERNSSNELQHSWQKTILKAIVMPGGKYRYEGRSGYGAAVLVSDGTKVWDYHVYGHDYTQKPASEEEPKHRIIANDDMPLMTARELVRMEAHRADRLNSATLLPEETILAVGKNIPCYVVQYSEKDFKRKDHDLQEEMTIWISKESKTVVKTLSREHTVLLPNHIPIYEETTVTYDVAELDGQVPADTFAFSPPNDAKLVENFPNPFRSSSEAATANLLGKPAPELNFHGTDGKALTLSSLRGKPVFLEFWATWCGPCVELIPDLKQLYAETRSKGLVWISVDDDDDAKTANQFLSREHAAWPNYHDGDGSLGKLVQREGIPLGILIDSEGKVRFYESGYGIAELRAAIAKLGPEFSAVSAAQDPSPSDTAKKSQ